MGHLRTPFVFFNACEVARTGRVASFVTGWAPAMLEMGAGGYIGALWPIGDRHAMEFSRAFYENLLNEFKKDHRHEANVAEVLRRTRSDLRSNATALSYVYYGDTNLRLFQSPERAHESGALPRVHSDRVGEPLNLN